MRKKGLDLLEGSGLPIDAYISKRLLGLDLQHSLVTVPSFSGRSVCYQLPDATSNHKSWLKLSLLSSA